MSMTRLIRHSFVNFKRCVFLSPLISNIAMIQKIYEFLKRRARFGKKISSLRTRIYITTTDHGLKKQCVSFATQINQIKLQTTNSLSFTQKHS